MRRKAARHRFDTYIGKIKVMDNLRQSVANQSVRVVAYGSSDFYATGKGEQTMPVKEVFNMAKRYMKVVITPEPNTTKNCAGCWNLAEKCGKGGRSIRCRSTQCSGWNRQCRNERNFNACENLQLKRVWLETTNDVLEAFKSKRCTGTNNPLELGLPGIRVGSIFTTRST